MAGTAIGRHLQKPVATLRIVPWSGQRRLVSGGANFRSGSGRSVYRLLGGVVAGGLVAVAYARYWRGGEFGPSRVDAFSPKKWKDDTEKAFKLTARERRFIKFASNEFDGQLYMTPQDFLDSVVEQEPRRK